MKKLITVLAVLTQIGIVEAKTVTLLNVSYDPTRELYTAINKAFAEDWKKKTGDDVVIRLRKPNSCGFELVILHSRFFLPPYKLRVIAEEQ